MCGTSAKASASVRAVNVSELTLAEQRPARRHHPLASAAPCTSVVTSSASVRCADARCGPLARSARSSASISSRDRKVKTLQQPRTSASSTLNQNW